MANDEEPWCACFVVVWYYGVCGIKDMDLIANSDGRYRIHTVRLRKKFAKQT